MRILIALQWWWPAGMDSGSAHMDSWFALWFGEPGGWALVDGQHHELAADQALVVPPGHWIARGTAEPAATRFAHFRLGAIHDRIRHGPLVLPCRGAMVAARDAVFAEDRLPVPHQGALQLLQFLAQSVQCFPATAWPEPEWDPRLDRVLSAIGDAPVHPWTNVELAGLFGAGEAHFRRCFAACMGLTPQRYLMRHRLEGVAVDLVHGDERIEHLAERWGFADRNHLSTAFARHYGCGPATWRRMRA